MSASAINISAPIAPGAGPSGLAGVAVDGALGGFDAVMSAILASTDAALQIAAEVPSQAGVGAPATAAALPLDWAQLEAAAQGEAPATTNPSIKAPHPPVENAPALMPALMDEAFDGADLPAPPVTLALVDALELAPQTPAVDAEPMPAGDGEAAAELDGARPQDTAVVLAMLAPAPAQPAPAEPAAEPPPPGSAPPSPQASEVLPPPTAAEAGASELPGQAEAGGEAQLDGPGEQSLADPKPAAAAPKRHEHAIAASAVPATPAAKVETAAPQAAASGPAQPPLGEVAAAAPPSPPEKPAKAARGDRDQASAEAPDSAGPTRNPQAASPAVSAAAQPGMTRDSRPDQAADGEPKPAEALADQGRAPEMPAEPAPAPAASASSAAAPSAPPVRGSPETVASLAAQMIKKLGARTTNFDVQLDPIGLGRVNVRVEINADGRVSAAMSCENPQAAAELKSRANELQRALAQSGFDISGGLSFDVAQDRGSPAGQQNAFQGEDRPGHVFRGRAFAAALETAGDAAQAALTHQRKTPSGVDVRI